MQVRVQDFPLHHRAPSSAGLAGWSSRGGIPILVAGGRCLDACFSLGSVLQSLKKCSHRGTVTDRCWVNKGTEEERRGKLLLCA